MAPLSCSSSCLLGGVLLFACSLPAFAQTKAIVPAQPGAGPAAAAASASLPPVPGVENPWDVRTILANVSQGNVELKALLDNLNPQQWVDSKGASTGYILQWQDAERQVNDVAAVTKALMQKTESLSLAIDDYFRLEAMDITVRSLDEGARKYADRAASDRLSRILARNFNTRERLRDYIRDLTVSTEQNFKIADAEAQRCRGMISRETRPAAKKSPR